MSSQPGSILPSATLPGFVTSMWDGVLVADAPPVELDVVLGSGPARPDLRIVQALDRFLAGFPAALYVQVVTSHGALARAGFANAMHQVRLLAEPAVVTPESDSLLSSALGELRTGEMVTVWQSDAGTATRHGFTYEGTSDPFTPGEQVVTLARLGCTGQLQLTEMNTFPVIDGRVSLPTSYQRHPDWQALNNLTPAEFLDAVSSVASGR